MSKPDRDAFMGSYLWYGPLGSDDQPAAFEQTGFKERLMRPLVCVGIGNYTTFGLSSDPYTAFVERFPEHFINGLGLVGMGARGGEDTSDVPILMSVEGAQEWHYQRTVNNFGRVRYWRPIDTASGRFASQAHFNQAGPILWIVTVARRAQNLWSGLSHEDREYTAEELWAELDASNSYYQGITGQSITLGALGPYTVTDGQSIGVNGILQLTQVTPGGTARILVAERELWFQGGLWRRYTPLRPGRNEFFAQVTPAAKLLFHELMGWLAGDSQSIA